MSGAIPPLPNTPLWRGDQLKHRDNNRDFEPTAILFFFRNVFWVSNCARAHTHTHTFPAMYAMTAVFSISTRHPHHCLHFLLLSKILVRSRTGEVPFSVWLQPSLKKNKSWLFVIWRASGLSQVYLKPPILAYTTLFTRGDDGNLWVK
jgi:hypothetical protein